MRVSVNILKHNGNALHTCRAFARGIELSGDEAVLRTERDHRMDDFDAAVLWGYVTPCQNIVKACRDKRIPFVFMDLGYFRRTESGYFKVTVNERHPTAYLMDTKLPFDRFERLKLNIRPWQRNGEHILLAGMSGKAAWSWKLEAESYEREAVRILKKYTKRCIIYRPKPSWPDARPIKHANMIRGTALEQALENAHCVVAHHSNVACEALLAGVPVFCKYGAASLFNSGELSQVETPLYPDGREQWAANLAYSQWNLHEMASGECWRHLKSVGLI